MYNSEIWTMTKSCEKKIDSFHRNLLRQIMNIRYPNIITNTTLYELTTEMKWSDRIKQNRIRFTGHLLRLPEETPVQQSLKIALTQSQLPRGRPQTTWIKLINNDLQSLNLDQIGSQKLRETASDKKTWKKIVAKSVVNGEQQ